MAGAAERQTLPSPSPERESGEFAKTIETPSSPEGSFQKMEGDAMKEVERAAKEAEAYAVAEGSPELAEQIRKDADAARLDVEKATDEAAAQVGENVEHAKPEVPIKLDEKEAAARVEALKLFLRSEDGRYQQRINELEEEERKTGKKHQDEIAVLRQGKLLSWRVAGDPRALSMLVNALHLRGENTKALHKMLEKRGSFSGIGALAQEEFLLRVTKKELWLKGPDESNAKEQGMRIVPGGGEKKEGLMKRGAKGTVRAIGATAAGVGLGATALVVSTPGILNRVAGVFDKIDAFLGMFTGGKGGLIKGIQDGLDGLTKKMNNWFTDKKPEK